MRQANRTGSALLFLPCLCLALAAGIHTAFGAQESGRQELGPLALSWGFHEPEMNGNAVLMTNEFTSVEFRAGSRKVILNGITVWMHEPLEMTMAGSFLLSQDVDDVVTPLVRPESILASRGHSVVVLDPGHGGEDDGTCSSDGSNEKKIALDLAKRVRRKLRNSQVKVRMTRDTDRFIPLDERVEKARKWGADIFVSIHLNAAASSSVSGLETFVLASPGCASTASEQAISKSYRGNECSPAGTLLGYYIQRGLVLCTGSAAENDRGLKRARFQVLRDMQCPAALVECGFLSNTKERGNLLDGGYRDKVADGMTSGILTYLSRVRNANSMARPGAGTTESDGSRPGATGPAVMSSNKADSMAQSPLRN